jgi:hypothetical protein
MHKNAMKCNKTQSKWYKNKHGASKIIDTFETYQWAGQRPGGQNVDLVRRRDLGEPHPDSQCGKALWVRDGTNTAIHREVEGSKRRSRRAEGADDGAAQTLCRSVILHREWKRTGRVASKPTQVGMGCKRATCRETSPINQRPLIWYRE